ncbi:chemotaxis protein CheB [Dictyobacter kobayashii]|uniref:protein-glutamate methylesterase n=1 Tax=Dictyobacter kobayashii TaxID=2014872 RepID=A0A402AQF9_9CHLR|nr:chemotaxis protein CheB [Dictyobacter kobayashii]GCE21332.1 hypothetical protein KDK_51320 [Dictyobacter kobayashii]
MRSLAQSQTSQAIGVILSGAGTDGTHGLQAIKEQGGITLAQLSTTATFSSMPQSAINAGCVDFIGSPQQIAEELTRMSHHPYLRQVQVVDADEDKAIPQVRGRPAQKMSAGFSRFCVYCAAGRR